VLFKDKPDGLTNVQEYNVVGGMLSYGGRVEYMISDQVGVGADVNYVEAGFAVKFEDFVYGTNGDAMQNANGDYLYTSYQSEYSVKRLRAMFRLNYHFAQSEKVDMYTGFAGGYLNTNRTIKTNPTNSKYEDEQLGDALIPVAIRIAVGAKMYFTQNIGAHVELGAFGGGILQAGLSVKF